MRCNLIDLAGLVVSGARAFARTTMERMVTNAPEHAPRTSAVA